MNFQGRRRDSGARAGRAHANLGREACKGRPDASGKGLSSVAVMTAMPCSVGRMIG